MVLLFFFISGATALLYEVLWTRLLGLVFGNTTYAISTVLAAYMAGLGLGGLLVGRWADRWRRPLLAYGCLEIGIGAYAALTFRLLEGIQFLYVGFARLAHPSPALFTGVRGVLSFIILFLPTFLMGATLPVLAKFYVRRAEAIGSGTALLYGLNTAGAVLGTLLTGFLLLPVLGMRDTLRLAFMLNIAIGLLACFLSKPGTLHFGTLLTASVSPNGASPGLRWIPAGLIVSGITAMWYEVGWTRALATVSGSSTYAFTLMLATFLSGLALGSAACERILSRRLARASDWGWLQITLALSALAVLPSFERLGIVTVRLFALTLGHPGWLELARFGFYGMLMIAPTFCFGALLPVSAALYTKDLKQIGRGLGMLYMANTFGNILGSLTAGFLLIPWLGIHRTLWAASAVGGILGLGVLLASRRPLIPSDVRPSTRPALSLPQGSGRTESKKTTGYIIGVAAAAILLLAGLWRFQEGWDPRLFGGGLHVRPYLISQMPTPNILAQLFDQQILFYREGVHSVVSVVQEYDHRILKVNGKPDASTSYDMSTQALLGHLPHLLHPAPRRTLVIGFGSGTTLRACLLHPIAQADCCEIEPAVLEAAPCFDSANHQSYRDPRARLILNDARNHLLIEPGRYDVIVSEPSNPWMAGVSNLFTVEFYQLVRGHLAPGGIFCQWLQTYTIAPDDVRMVAASLQSVFPHLSIWTSLPSDLLLVAGEEPLVFDLDRIQERLDGSPQLQEGLARFGIRKAAGLLSLFLLGEEDVRRYVKGSPFNTDDQLLLEFNTPWSLHRNRIDLVLEDLSLHRTDSFPPIRTSGRPVPKNPDAWVEIGERSLANEAFDSARIQFQNGLSLDPNNVGALVGLGRCAMQEGQRLQALDFYERAAALDPHSAEAKGYRGQLLLKEGNAADGLEAVREAQELDRSRWEFPLWEGKALETLGQWPQAVEAYQRTLSLKPNDLTARIGLARALACAGQPQEAARQLERMRREFTTVDRIYVELGKSYEQIGDLRPAIAAYKDLTRINPYHPEYWINLARLYAKANDPEGLQRAIQEGKKTDRQFLQLIKNFGRRNRALPAR